MDIRLLVLSCLLHAAFLVTFHHEMPPSPSSLRVDIVALPTEAHSPSSQHATTPQHASTPLATTPQLAPTPPQHAHMPSAGTFHTPQSDALARTRALVRMKGNRIQKGGSTSGTKSSDSAEATYLSELQSVLQGFWALPAWLLHDESLKAQVRLKLRHDGSFLSATIIQYSRNEQFDSSVQDVIDALHSATLPIPPPTFTQTLSGIVIKFPL